MTEFPTIVYRCPGIHRGNDGNTFNFRSAQDEDEFEVLTAEGWFATLPEAENPPEAKEPSARALLEAEAKRLDIGFNWKTSDESLIEKIEAASKDKAE